MSFSVLKPNKNGHFLKAEIKDIFKEGFFRNLLHEINVSNNLFQISNEKNNYFANKNSYFQGCHRMYVMTVYLQVYQKGSATFVIF